nr:hypothetical protein WI23_01785 [Burkholderia oklahomensis C6786]
MRRAGHHAQRSKRAARQMRCRVTRTPPPAAARRVDSRTIESEEKTLASAREDEAAHGSRDEKRRKRT